MADTISELWPIAIGVIVYTVFVGFAHFLKRRIDTDGKPIGNIPGGGIDEEN